MASDLAGSVNSRRVHHPGAQPPPAFLAVTGILAATARSPQPGRHSPVATARRPDGLRRPPDHGTGHGARCRPVRLRMGGAGASGSQEVWGTGTGNLE